MNEWALAEKSPLQLLKVMLHIRKHAVEFFREKKHTDFPQFEILCNSIIKDKLFNIDNACLLSLTTKFKWSYNYEF